MGSLRVNKCYNNIYYLLRLMKMARSVGCDASVLLNSVVPEYSWPPWMTGTTAESAVTHLSSANQKINNCYIYYFYFTDINK